MVVSVALLVIVCLLMCPLVVVVVLHWFGPWLVVQCLELFGHVVVVALGCCLDRSLLLL